MKWITGLLFFGFLFLYHTEAVCNFPSDWTGSWLHSLHGTVTLTTTTMQLSQYPDGSVTLNCDTLTNSKYLVLSNLFTETNGNSVYLLACLEITQLKTNLYKIIHRTPETNKAFNYRYVESGSNTVSEGSLCTDSSSDPDVEYFLLMKSGEIDTVKMNVPTPLAGTLAYTVDGSSCSGNTGSLTACPDKTLIDIDVNSCTVVIGYTNGGDLNAIYSSSSDNVYTIWTYNRDSSVDNSNTYRFTCWVATGAGDTLITVAATQRPQFCDATQTNTSVPAGGKTITGTLTTCGAMSLNGDLPNLFLALMCYFAYSIMKWYL